MSNKYICITCGKEFYKCPSQVRSGNCSKECGRKSQAVSLKGRTRSEEIKKKN